MNQHHRAREIPSPPGVDGEETLELRCDHPLGHELLLGAVATVLATVPGLRYRLLESSEPACWEGREHAFAFCLDARTRRSPLGIELGCLPLFLYASPRYLGENVDFEQVASNPQHRFADIDLGDANAPWRIAVKQATHDMPVPSGTARYRDVFCALQFAVSGRGLAWLPPGIAADDLARRNLRRVEPGVSRETPAAHVCIPHRRKPGQEALDVIFALTKAFKASPPALPPSARRPVRAGGLTSAERRPRGTLKMEIPR